jgi:hypothetical protein
VTPKELIPSTSATHTPAWAKRINVNSMATKTAWTTMATAIAPMIDAYRPAEAKPRLHGNKRLKIIAQNQPKQEEAMILEQGSILTILMQKRRSMKNTACSLTCTLKTLMPTHLDASWRVIIESSKSHLAKT